MFWKNFLIGAAAAMLTLAVFAALLGLGLRVL